ncbi:MAG: hypothetical protein ABFS12_13670 [Bacteroidota bacterium]
MQIDYYDKSIYFKGLLLLIKRDRVIENPERKLMQDVGKFLGFEKDFIQDSIDDVLDNKYLTEDIPVFSNKTIAESFLLDGLKLSFSDNDFAPEEVEYLTEVAKQNGLDTDWFASMLKSYLSHFDVLNDNSFLFIENYLSEDTSEIHQ